MCKNLFVAYFRGFTYFATRNETAQSGHIEICEAPA